MRETHGFARTECGCVFCQAPCRHIPGSLDPSDLTSLCPAGQDVFIWAEQHLRAVVDKAVPRLVPARQANGHCHWYFENRCLVHEHAPYSCAFFDTHMTDEEIARRSAATLESRRKDAAAQGLYFRVWEHLIRMGLTTPPGDRAALEEDVHKLFRHAQRRWKLLKASNSGDADNVSPPVA